METVQQIDNYQPHQIESSIEHNEQHLQQTVRFLAI